MLFKSIAAKFSLLTLSSEGIIRVTAVAQHYVDIDSLGMVLFIDKGKC